MEEVSEIPSICTTQNPSWQPSSVFRSWQRSRLKILVKFKQPFSGVEMLLADEKRSFQKEGDSLFVVYSTDASDGPINVLFCFFFFPF